MRAPTRGFARLAVAVALTLAVRASPAYANPVDAFGLGSRGAAMAGAQTADATDFSANYYNPAGLARGRRLQLHLGYFYADPDLRTSAGDTDVEPAHGVVLGLAAPGRLFGVPVAFGLGLHLPDEHLSRVRAVPQRQPRWELFGARNQRLLLATNVAVAPFETLSIGAGLSFMSATDAALDLTGDVNVLPEDSVLRHRVDADLTAVRYPQAGVRWAPLRWLEVGVVYRGQFQLDLALDTSLTGRVVSETGCASDDCFLADGFFLLATRSVSAFQPQQVVVGAAVRPDGRTRIAVDLGWMDWSAYVSPASRVTFDLQLDVHVPDLVVPEPPPPADVVAPRFHDTWVPRVGVERLVFTAASGAVTLAGRAGYAFEASPVPAQSGLTNLVDGDRHHLTGGVGARFARIVDVLPGPITLDAHVQVTVVPERRIEKTDPADPVGDYTARGVVTTYGATLGSEW